jgi:hypothetical protein
MTAPITPLHIALAHHLIDAASAAGEPLPTLDQALSLLDDCATLTLMRDVLSRLGRTAPKSVQQWLSEQVGVSLAGETHETANETAAEPYPTLLSRGADNCEDLLSPVDPLDETAESFFHYANPSLSS